MTKKICQSALVLLQITWVEATIANQCDLSAYDNDAPQHVADRTPATSESFFEWASDVDPFQGSGRGWHYIRNLHSRDLSLRWGKPKLVIAFNNPLPKDGVFCKRDYGDVNRYQRDDDAPIYVPGDGDKSAVAYVKGTGQSTQVGASLETNYRDDKGDIAYGIAQLIIRYYGTDQVLELDMSASPVGTSMAFDPGPIGIRTEVLVEAIERRGMSVSRYSSLKNVAAFDDLVAETLLSDLDSEFILVSGTSDSPLVFSDVRNVPRGRTPLLLISPEREVVVATYVDLSDLKATQ